MALPSPVPAPKDCLIQHFLHMAADSACFAGQAATTAGTSTCLAGFLQILASQRVSLLPPPTPRQAENTPAFLLHATLHPSSQAQLLCALRRALPQEGLPPHTHPHPHHNRWRFLFYRTTALPHRAACTSCLAGSLLAAAAPPLALPPSVAGDDSYITCLNPVSILLWTF